MLLALFACTMISGISLLVTPRVASGGTFSAVPRSRSHWMPSSARDWITGQKLSHFIKPLEHGGIELLSFELLLDYSPRPGEQSRTNGAMRPRISRQSNWQIHVLRQALRRRAPCRPISFQLPYLGGRADRLHVHMQIAMIVKRTVFLHDKSHPSLDLLRSIKMVR